MKLSLHIGLNALDPQCYGGFQGWLNACENDATALAQISVDRGCTAVGDLTSQATRGAFLETLNRCSEQMTAGDLLVISFSGHGSQIPSFFAESDHYDETLCFFDGQLIDGDLRKMLSRFRAGVKVLLILDACHSGGMDRALEGVRKPRVLPARLRRALASDYPRQPRATTEISASVLLFAACAENETAADGSRFGEWTGSLVSAWERCGSWSPTWREWFNLAQSICRGQTPQLRELGAADMLDKKAFA